MNLLMIDPDDKGVMTGTMLPPPPGWVPPTIEESLARGFEKGAEFYSVNGKPVVMWPYWDYAEDWSVHPKKEMHPFIPVMQGQEITENEFRAMVNERHGKVGIGS
jgi:hypothetical protein